jgi:hypothetical protein
MLSKNNSHGRAQGSPHLSQRFHMPFSPGSKRTKTSIIASLLAPSAIAALVASQSAFATDQYWEVNVVSGFGGTGTWDTTVTNLVWNDSTGTGVPASWTNGNNGFFQGTAGTVTAGAAAVSATGLNFGVGGYVISGTNTVTVTNSGTGTTSAINATNATGTNTISAPLVLGAAAAATQTFTQASGGTLAVNGVISSSNAIAGLTLTGGGAFTFSGANIYSGGTSVSAGSLFVNNTSGSGTGTGTIAVAGSGTTLGGNGIMTGAVSVASGNNLAPGASGVGSTAVLKTGALTLSSGSNFQVDIKGTTVGTGYDQLAVTNGASIAGSHLLVSVGATFTQADVGDKFAILSNITAGAISGQLQGLSEGATFNSGADQFMITYLGNAGDGTNGNDIVLTLTAAPEPSTWFAGALALGAMGYSQRRRLARLGADS